MWQEWNEVLLADDQVWDQNAFNDLFRRDMKFDGPESTNRIFRSVDCTKTGHPIVSPYQHLLSCFNITFFLLLLPMQLMTKDQ